MPNIIIYSWEFEHQSDMNLLIIGDICIGMIIVPPGWSTESFEIVTNMAWPTWND